ncbi:hypothetical protein O3G_MSEX002053 [Manduca sexta]|uniref:Zinc finger CCHC domain-containing protein 7 n=1 Tax=Manduca sexta TaxID=7130 RepID=A0A921YM59_MANSE|nr:hypothetical protein O3G_MSEX002053 [Manduca sexta]
MLHHVDETQSDVKESSQNDEQTAENAPRSTIRRYWRTSGDYIKATAPKDAQPAIKTAPKDPPVVKPATNTSVPKEERRKSTAIQSSTNQPVIQLPPQNVKSTVEIVESELDKPVLLESSDEDEVIEVALPPKPTITIESSDEDELQIIKTNSPAKLQNKLPERSVSASPVPSVVSSVSDEFIRGDCIALNISSRRTDNPSFDFSLHGSDLLDQSTPSKKKKKKKSKEALTSTPIVTQKSAADECFATPKSKAKNKKRKSYTISEKSVPNADVYDSDSNQSIIETNKSASYVVSEKSLPSADVYESDSSYSELVKEKNVPQINDIVSSDSNISLDKPLEETPKTTGKNKHSQNELAVPIVDLTQNDTYISLDTSDICESIVMGNVSGFPESENYGDENVPQNDISKFVSTKIPPILNEDLDFDNLKGKNKVCKRRRYSLTTLRADMEKFYNESWGGENFNHREIQKNMSRDKSLWAIDPKDRVPTSAKRRVTCNYCNRPGHRDDTCRMKPPVCYMCGHTGHFEPRCPRKICINCGSPNHMYSTMCRNCCSWGTIRCNECGQNGHPASHCPDIWRRYHNTIDLNVPLEKCTQTRKHFQLYCSGCTRRGHLIHTCRSTLPFSGLPINSPYVYLYRPVYSSSPQDMQNESNNSKNVKASNNNDQDTSMSPANNSRLERNKRQSKSPTVHETHVNKKRNLSITDEVDLKRSTKSPINNTQRKTSLSSDDNNKNKKEINKTPTVHSPKTVSSGQKALDFIAVGSTNFDKRGHIIQDNEVSDTSDVVTSARIYVTNEIINNLKSKEGEVWLNDTMAKHNVVVECIETNSFLSIKGKVGDQEAFQTALREWSNIQNEETTAHNDSNVSNDSKNDQCDLSLIPKNRNNLLRQLSKALNSLKEDIGDPKDLYKELTFFQNRHQQLLKQKTVSPKQVSNNRCNINLMLKKLNMVLLGQAGLADGSQHLSELHLFHEQLMNSTQKFIPPELRKEIGHHYYNIFAAIPRDDYVELLKKFYQTSTAFKRKKKERSFHLNPKINRFNKSLNSNPHQQIYAHVEKPTKFGDNVSSNNMRQKLVFYHQRLLKTQPNGAVLKKTRVELVRKLHSFIASMFRNEKVSSKTMKKMKKAQEQAHTFLANV